MYIQAVHIQNIKGLADVRLSFDESHPEGWHVILGDNSAGKTTLIRALALALVGPPDAMALQQDWARWVHSRYASANIKLRVSFEKDWSPSGSKINLGLSDIQEFQFNISKINKDGKRNKYGKQASIYGSDVGNVDVHSFRLLLSINHGWFSASFGPYRRFRGGDRVYQMLFNSNPNIARHLSAFREEVDLSESLVWLINKKIHKKKDQLDKLFNLINNYQLLPHGVKLDHIKNNSLYFKDGNGMIIEVDELADGYRSILSLALELLRQMELVYGLDDMFDKDSGQVIVSGVVLVDEIDAHLHPSWQETVGRWFTDRFPKIQFIVATHSALVCRSIGPTGKVYRLRTPGTDGNQVEEVTGESRDILWFGSLERALESAAFQLNIGRSEYGWERVEEMRTLVQTARKGSITDEQRARLRHLRAVLADAGEGD